MTPRSTTFLVILALVAAVVVGGYFLLPSGFSSDLDRIGQGRPAVVIVHDHNYVESVELMENLDAVRGPYEPEVDFLVADLNHPDGAAFADRHEVSAVTLLVFDGQGERIGMRTGRARAPELRAWLEQRFPDAVPDGPSA